MPSQKSSVKSVESVAKLRGIDGPTGEHVLVEEAGKPTIWVNRSSDPVGNGDDGTNVVTASNGGWWASVQAITGYTWEKNQTFAADLLDGAGNTVYDQSNNWIPQGRLEADSVTVSAGDGLKSGGSVALGGSTTLNIEPADFAGTFLSDDGSDNLQVNTTGDLESDGSDNLRISSSVVGNGLTGGSGSAIGVATDGIGTDEIDQSITPTWTGGHTWNTGANADLSIDEGGLSYNTASTEVFNLVNNGTGSTQLHADGLIENVASPDTSFSAHFGSSGVRSDGGIAVNSRGSVFGGVSLGENVGNVSTSQVVTQFIDGVSVVQQVRYVNSGSGPEYQFGKTRSGTVGSSGNAATSGDTLFKIRAYGDDGTDIQSEGAQIQGVIDGSVSTDTIPGRLELYTTATGGTLTKALQLDSSQNVTVPNGSVGLGHSATDYLVDMAGEFSSLERSSDPANPAEGQYVMWMSDGTGSGADGDIMMKVTAGATTKTITLVDFSAN